MNRYRTGMLAKSLAGHDEGQIYVIVAADQEYVYLADGKIRLIEKPKKKKKKHVQIILKQYDISEADNVAIKRILKDYNKEEEKEDQTYAVKG